MLSTRSLPPQFLLPAWSAHQLAIVQRAYSSEQSKSVARLVNSKSLRRVRSRWGPVLPVPKTSFKDPAVEADDLDAKRDEGDQGGLPIRRLQTYVLPIRKTIAKDPAVEADDFDAKKDEGDRGGLPIRPSPALYEDRWFQIPGRLSDFGNLREIHTFNPKQSEEDPASRAFTIADSKPRTEVSLHSKPTTPPTRSKTAKEANGQEQEEPEKPNKPKPARSSSLSLYDELFPDKMQKETPRDQKLAELRLDKLPAFNWIPGIDIADSGQRMKATEGASEHPLPQGGPRKRKVVTPSNKPSDMRNSQETSEESITDVMDTKGLGLLVLNACSDTLEESDFFRISSKGRHIEGWKSGLLKIIPTRANETLERLGSYLLLFSNDTAATAYLDQTIRLHTLDRLERTRKEAHFPLPPGYLEEGENLKNLLRGFSLIPGFVKLSMRELSNPWSPRVQRLIETGGPAAIAGKKANAQHMVLFTTDRSHISPIELADTLKQDGKRRNMSWNFAGKFHDSIISLERSDQKQLEELVGPIPRTGKFKEGGGRSYNGPGRFIISFRDSHEARRFVREWHCRPLPTRHSQRAEDEPPTVNAEILW